MAGRCRHQVLSWIWRSWKANLKKDTYYLRRFILIQVLNAIELHHQSSVSEWIRYPISFHNKNTLRWSVDLAFWGEANLEVEEEERRLGGGDFSEFPKLPLSEFNLGDLLKPWDGDSLGDLLLTTSHCIIKVVFLATLLLLLLLLLLTFGEEGTGSLLLSSSSSGGGEIRCKDSDLDFGEEDMFACDLELERERDSNSKSES